ncbi:hypothetical protein, partial [Pedobacter ginsenosidimutans]|uniref:hypothetical protein n=1 Tax=Pedobacter ginsenosidimutans TaxID=687842 RepID=UPI000A74F292
LQILSLMNGSISGGEGNLKSRSVFVQRERDNLGSRPAIKFAYSLARNRLYSFSEIRTLMEILH